MPYFVFGQERDWDGYGPDTFVVAIDDPDQVAHARGLIAGSETDRTLIGGVVTMAPASYNIGWSFHIAPADLYFADGFTEIGDNDIRGVEAGVNAFGDGFLPGNLWTPWTVHIVTELNLVSGGINADTLQGTQLADIIFGRGGDDSLSGGEGSDHLIGGKGTDRLQGGSGRDKLSGGDGDDVLKGGDGKDILDGGAGTDELAGGAGNDTYHVRAAGEVITEAAGGGVDAVWSWISYTLAHRNVEDLRLMDTGFASIDGTGNALDNRIWGNWGINVLSGGNGDDMLDGHAGNDVLVGGEGDDTLIGGGDSDTASYASAAGAVRVSLALTTAQDTLGAGIDTLAAMPWETMTSIENLVGSAFADKLIGNEAANALDGGGGADRMSGGAGDDRYVVDDSADKAVEASASGGTDLVESSVSFSLEGQYPENLALTGIGATDGTGNALDNIIRGNSAANILRGGSGDDKLYGRAGNDVLRGGEGQDGFCFDTPLGASTNVDRILDFDRGDDTIFLDRDVFRKVAAGTLSADAFHVGKSAADAEDRIVYDKSSGKIFYDADGSGGGAAILFAQVTAGTTLTNADFVAVI
jgi:Ca2+-binding RTX toxin-like protein